MMAELDQMFQEKAVRRIGTGEFTDSMIWEAWTDLSGVLVPRFAAQSHAVLELKTKTTAIDRLMGLDHQRKTIAAWSVNTPKIIRECERGASSLAARFRAARQCADRGYPLAFHFDPMIIYKGCEEDYREVVRGIFACALPENIAWISMGAFRFMPALKPIIQKRFPDSDIVYGEFIPGIDNKMRYFKPLRIQLFQKIYAAIKEIAPDVTVYLCMEDDEVWEKAFGFIPSDVGGISEMLDRSAIKICNLKP
jgi:spore photoproduct lyase